jgi:hypothetical protein
MRMAAPLRCLFTVATHLSIILSAIRNIHALFQAELPEKAHGYCVQTFESATAQPKNCQNGIFAGLFSTVFLHTCAGGHSAGTTGVQAHPMLQIVI